MKAILIVAGLALLCAGCGKKTAEARQNAPEARNHKEEGSGPASAKKGSTGQPEAQPWLFTSVDLSSMYADNPVRGKKWNSAPVLIVGTVQSINGSYVSLLGHDVHGTANVRCYWAKADGFGKLNPHDYVILRGVIEGKSLGGVVVRKCSLLEHSTDDPVMKKWFEMKKTGRVWDGQDSPN